MSLSYTAEKQGIALANTAHEPVILATCKANMKVSELKLLLASARPVYYYSVYPDTLQMNGLCTTPGKALGLELILLPGRDELITSSQVPMTLSYTARKARDSSCKYCAR